MRSYLALCIAAAIVGAACADDTSDCAFGHFGGHCYQKHSLAVSGGAWRLLGIDRNRNMLYLGAEDQVRQCPMSNGQCVTMNITWFIRELTVDQQTGDTYGNIDDSSFNLYKLDLVNNDIKLLVHGGVLHTAFKDKLYYSSECSGIHIYENGTSRVVPGSEKYVVPIFFVDKNDDIYFRHFVKSKFVISRLSGGVVDQTVNWNKSYWMTGDKEGNVVFIHQLSHVVYRAINGKLVEFGAIQDNIYQIGLFETPLFDKNNDLIYRTTSSSNYYHLRIMN